MNPELLPKWAAAVFGLTIVLGIVLMAKFWRSVINQAPAVKREEMEREVRANYALPGVIGLLVMAAVLVIGLLKWAGKWPEGW